MQDQEIKKILERYRSGNATEKDKIFLESWYLWYHPSEEIQLDYNEKSLLADADTVWNNLDKANRRRLAWLPYAAAAVLVLSLMGLWWWNTTQYLRPEDILPENRGATIKLGNGKVIPLSATRKGIIMDNQLRYADGSPITGFANNSNPGEELLLDVPLGASYQITLEDGSKVWLNSGSSLRYPAHFSGDKRLVKLTGEAYFEINKQFSPLHHTRVPFLVRTKYQDVEVKGTHFNIRAYDDEDKVKTTLAEGRVAVKNIVTGKLAELLPGLQSITGKNSTAVKRVEVDSEIAWKSGRFSFEGKPFAELINEIGRCYNLRIKYEGAVPQVTFFGDAYRTESLAALLGFLESAGIEYKVKSDRTLIIINKKEGQP